MAFPTMSTSGLNCLSGCTIVGRLGPYTSTSKIPTYFGVEASGFRVWSAVKDHGRAIKTIPTLYPFALREKARLTEVVDLPTPPLQLAHATTFLTPIWHLGFRVWGLGFRI